MINKNMCESKRVFKRLEKIVYFIFHIDLTAGFHIASTTSEPLEDGPAQGRI